MPFKKKRLRENLLVWMSKVSKMFTELFNTFDSTFVSNGYLSVEQFTNFII